MTAGGGYVAAFFGAVLAIAASVTLHRSRWAMRGGAEIDASANPS